MLLWRPSPLDWVAHLWYLGSPQPRVFRLKPESPAPAKKNVFKILFTHLFFSRTPPPPPTPPEGPQAAFFASRRRDPPPSPQGSLGKFLTLLFPMLLGKMNDTDSPQNLNWPAVVQPSSLPMGVLTH